MRSHPDERLVENRLQRGFANVAGPVDQLDNAVEMVVVHVLLRLQKVLPSSGDVLFQGKSISNNFSSDYAVMPDGILIALTKAAEMAIRRQVEHFTKSQMWQRIFDLSRSSMPPHQ
jgi:hypothetical protein